MFTEAQAFYTRSNIVLTAYATMGLTLNGAINESRNIRNHNHHSSSRGTAERWLGLEKAK